MRKSFVSRYLEYLRDNPKEYWFKNKVYGYGWTPVTLRGGLLTLFLVVVILFIPYFSLYGQDPGIKEIILFFIHLGIVMIVFMHSCLKLKLAPKMKWSWGFK